MLERASFFRSITFERAMEKSGDLVKVNHSDTVGKVLSTLCKQHILSAPIIESDGKSHSSIDVLDLVAYINSKLDLNKEHTQKPEEQQIEEFFQKEIKNLGDISNRNPWIQIHYSKSIKKSMKFLSQPSIHRVWLVENEKPVGVFTQSDLIKIIWNHKAELTLILKKSIRELFPESRSPRVISENERMIDAFTRINHDRVSGLAVINQEGKLVGNISATDLKFANFDNGHQFLKTLKGPIKEFLDSKSDKAAFFSHDKPHYPFEPVTVKYEDSLETAIEKICQNDVHRIYVVDDDLKPMYVLSLSDIIGQFVLWA